MSKIAGLFASKGFIAASAVSVAIIGGAGVFFKDALLRTPEPESGASEPVETQKAAAPASEDTPPNNDQTTNDAAATSAQSADAEAAAEPAPAPRPQVPSFDTVRVEPDGTTLVAGTAASDALVRIVLSDAPIAEAAAGRDGKFAIFVKLAPSDEARVMRLESDAGMSFQSVIIAPIVAVEEEVVPEAEPSVDVAATATEPSVAPETPPSEPSATVAEAEPKPEPKPKAQAVLIAGEDGVEVVQAPSPDVMSNVALDVISYSEEGAVELQGRAPSGGFVRVYLDNEPITTGRISEDGSWRTDLPDVDTGVYTLRVDEVSAEGAVQSRVETPFKREAAEAVSLAESTSQVNLVTVQPGATLWAIAEARFGEGRLYVQVYEANRDRIKDPDLIYPGQVFDLPN